MTTLAPRLAVIVLCALIAPPVQAAALVSFEALVPAGEPVVAQGHLEVEGKGILARGEGLTKQILVRDANLSVLLYETRWQTVGTEDAAPATEKKSGTRRLGPFPEAELRSESDQRGALWAAVSRFPFDRLGSATTCAFSADRVPPPAAPRPLPSEARARDNVRATCGAGSIAFEGRPDLFVFSARLNITYAGRDADPARLEGRTGDSNLEILVGEIVAPNESLPLVYDHVERWARFVTFDSDALHPIQGSAGWSVAAPAMIVVGSLTIPPGAAQVLWDGWSRADGSIATRPEGVFDLTISGEQRLLIEGFTTNQPPLRLAGTPAAPEIPSSPLIPAAALGLALGGLAWRLRFAVIALYSRLTESSVLRHERRSRVFGFVQANPGSSIQEAAQGLGLPRRSVKYHAEVLVRAGLVHVRREGRETALYPTEALSRAGPIELRAVRSRVNRVLEVIAKQPAITHRELARHVGVTRSYVSRLLKRLQAAGMIVQQGVRGRRFYTIKRRMDSAMRS